MEYSFVDATNLMRRTPSALRALLHELPATWLDSTEGPGTWSPRDVASHMADLEQDRWLPRIRTILDHGTERALDPVDPERFRVRYAGASLGRVLDEFESARTTNLEELGRILAGGAALSADGLHPVCGSVRLSHLLSTWLVHDLTHVSQIARVLAAQYRDATGPFSAFLSILGTER